MPPAGPQATADAPGTEKSGGTLRRRPAIITAAAILLFDLAALLLLLGLWNMGRTEGAPDLLARSLLVVAVGVADLVAGLLVLRLHDAGRVLGITAACVTIVFFSVNTIDRAGDSDWALFLRAAVAGLFALVLNLLVIVFLVMKRQAFAKG
jgi:hypothetical protein